jgi:hypothetical protein
LNADSDKVVPIMTGDSRQTRRFGAFLFAVCLLHAALLLLPGVRRTALEAPRAPVVKLRLEAAEPPAAPPPVARQAEPAVPVAPAPEAIVPRALPVETMRDREPETPTVTAHRILSDLAARRERDPLAGLESAAARREGFHSPLGPSLDEVLNEPSLQLPFRDTRIYLVDSYANGPAGSIDRFFDRVSMPFGFQTKNNTRIQCVWILVIAGCAWGDASLFYAADRARKRPTVSR